MREYERCELCGPGRRGGAHLYAIDGALSESQLCINISSTLVPEANL